MIVQNVGKALNVTTKDEKIDTCHVGYKSNGEVRPRCVVKFVRRTEKEQLMN